MKNYLEASPCACKKVHVQPDCEVLMGKGVITRIPQLVRAFSGKRPFILADADTYDAAGREIRTILTAAGIPCSAYIFPQTHPEPDEKAVGSAVMHFDCTCDLIIGVGSGVINDIGKILSAVTGRKYIIAATAPSMDGYASASSSMTQDGLKISLPSKNPDAIVGDTDILKNAPLHMLKAGIGDMIAKYISIGEWRIASLITGEYYCEQIAALVRTALARCIQNAPALLDRDEQAVESVFEGLIIAGAAMAYAGVSRPASGVEHYFSHVWDMRAVAFGAPMELHGIQCGIGALYAARIYDTLRTLIPDREKALSYVQGFDFAAHQAFLRSYIGPGAEAMIAAESRDKKYDPDCHARRLDRILENWEEIRRVIDREIPPAAEIERILDIIQAPKSCADFGIPEAELPMAFAATKDIRDKYVLSRLCFDLGISQEVIA